LDYNAISIEKQLLVLQELGLVSVVIDSDGCFESRLELNDEIVKHLVEVAKILIKKAADEIEESEIRNERQPNKEECEKQASD